MKAVTFNRYAGPEGLTLTELSPPEPGPGQVLVEVAFAALNAFDWHHYHGDPYLMRMQTGLRVKEPHTVGADLAGTVTAVGDGITEVSIGDRVMAEPGFGACAQFALANVDALAHVPSDVGLEHAAAVIMGGTTSLQALRDTAALQRGERVLVWGASGGVGHLAIQVALALGASRVDAVCSGANAAMVGAHGATRVFDYTSEAVEGETYDVILDTVATASTRQLRALLAPGGRVITIGATGGGRVLGPLGPLMRRTLAAKLQRVNAAAMFAHSNAADLAILGTWLADGSLTPVIQQVYPIERTADACRELETGHVAGKLVIAVE